MKNIENNTISHLFSREITIQAIKDSFIKLNPVYIGEESCNFYCGHWCIDDHCRCYI